MLGRLCGFFAFFFFFLFFLFWGGGGDKHSTKQVFDVGKQEWFTAVLLGEYLHPYLPKPQSRLLFYPISE